MKIPVLHRRSLAAALLVAGLLPFAAGCGASKRSERIKAGEVVINAGDNPRSLDPGLATDTASSRSLLPFMRGLTMQESDGKPRLEMAESLTPSADGLTWDVKIRKSAWTNGEPVTSGDFAYAWIQRMLNPKFGAEYAYMLFYIAGAKEFYEGKSTDPSTVGVETPAPDHLRIRLRAPAPFFPQLLAHHSYFPVFRGIDHASPQWAVRAETYIGNGPFKLVAYSSGDRIEGAPNPGYWNAGAVRMKKLTLRFINEETTEQIAFESEELDATYTAPRPNLEALRATGCLRETPKVGTYFLNFNMTRDIFKDVRVRKAFALAIDRAAIVKNVTRSGEPPALRLVPPSLYGEGEYPSPLKDAAYDEAKRLMAEAGFPDGKGFPKVDLIYNTLELHRSNMQVLQESWRKHLGVEVELRNAEFKVHIDARRKGDFDLARNGWIADFFDPINFLELFMSDSGNNDSHWKDPEFDAMLDRARTELDPAKRLELLRAAEDYLLENVPILPIYNYAQPHLAAPELEGYDISPMDTFDAAALAWKN